MEPTGLDENVGSLGGALDRERREADEILQESYVVQQPAIDDPETLEVDIEAGPSLTLLALWAGLAVGGGLLAYALLNQRSGPRHRLQLRNRFDAVTSSLRARGGLHALSPRTRPDMVMEGAR